MRFSSSQVLKAEFPIIFKRSGSTIALNAGPDTLGKLRLQFPLSPLAVLLAPASYSKRCYSLWCAGLRVGLVRIKPNKYFFFGWTVGRYNHSFKQEDNKASLVKVEGTAANAGSIPITFGR